LSHVRSEILGDMREHMSNTITSNVSPVTAHESVVGTAPSPQPLQSDLLEQPLPTASEPQSPQCSKCSQALEVNENICKHCGYYETAGIFVELEKSTGTKEPVPFMWQVFVLPAVMFLIVLFHIWQIDFQEFPKSFPWMFSAGVGLTAMFCSLIILRSLPNPFAYEAVEKKEKPVITLVAPSNSGPGADSLEDAIENFTDKVEIIEVEGTEEEVPEEDREYLDCVIVGYNQDPAAPDRVSSLVIAVKENDQLRIVANVTKGIAPEMRVKLKRNLDKVLASVPPVESKLQAVWVKPGYRCRTWYTEEEDGSRSGMNFDRMLFIGGR